MNIKPYLFHLLYGLLILRKSFIVAIKIMQAKKNKIIGKSTAFNSLTIYLNSCNNSYSILYIILIYYVT